MVLVLPCFNPSIEGQPLQHGKLYLTGDELYVSIPLSRDSHCNMLNSSEVIVCTTGFNPSIEGQPLQPFNNDIEDLLG